METATEKRNKMRGGVRRRGARGKWTYVIDLGILPAQRCSDCNLRFWIDRKPRSKCPKCGGGLRETQERRQQQAGGFETRTQALAARNTALHDLGQGTLVVRDNITLAKYLQEEWLPSLELSALRQTTLASYKSHVRNHLAPTKLGAMRLQQLRREQIAKHYAWLMVEGRCDGEGRVPSSGVRVRP